MTTQSWVSKISRATSPYAVSLLSHSVPMPSPGRVTSAARRAPRSAARAGTDRICWKIGLVYPVALSVRGRRVVVVGGGAVAERKVRGLLGAERDVDELATMKAGAVEHEVERAADTLAGVVPAQTQPLVCATRASLLAMTQARTVMSLLAKAGLPSTVLEVTTRGDAVQDRSIAAIGTDNVFVKELELALREGRADYAVHSCKDLPSTLSEDMTLAAVTAREDPRDAYCSERYPAFADLPAGARVGTSSPRRRAQLRALRPDLVYDDVRGNVDTRLRKLRDGEYAAIVLAAAGLNRLGARAAHTVPFAVDVVTPAVGQGSLGIETRAGDALAGRIDAVVGDPPASLAVRAERAFLRTVHGGCQAPVGCHATWSDGRFRVVGAIAAADGSQVLRAERDAVIGIGDLASAEAVAVALARDLLADGGAALLGGG